MAFDDDTTGFAHLLGVWTYSTDDRTGHYLIARCGASLFYYEDDASSLLFGILVEGSVPAEAVLSCMLSPAGQETTTFMVVLGTGLLILCSSADRMTLRFKPWNGGIWQDPLTASRVGKDDAELEATKKSPLDWALSVQKITIMDEYVAQQSARLAAVDRAASIFQTPDETGEAAQKKAAATRPNNHRSVDVSGTWSVTERTEGIFTFSLRQAADSSLEGEWRYRDSSGSGWSKKIAGYVEGRRVRWTAFAWKGGALSAEDSENTMTVISPCGRHLAGVGPIGDGPERLRQHFSASLTNRPMPAAARAANAVRDAKEAQARRDEQEAPPPLQRSRSWAASFSSVSFTAAPSSTRTPQSPQMPPVSRMSFGFRKSQSITATPWTDEEVPPNQPSSGRLSFSGRKSQSLTLKPWNDEEEPPSTLSRRLSRGFSFSARGLAGQSQIGETPEPKVARALTSHRPGSKRAELARRMRTAANLFRGGSGGNRGAASETSGGPPGRISDGGASSWLASSSLSGSQSVSSADPRQAGRAVAQKWF